MIKRFHWWVLLSKSYEINSSVKCQSDCLCVYIVTLSLSLAIPTSVCDFIVCITVCLSLSSFIYLCVHIRLSVCKLVRQTVRLCLCQSVRLCKLVYVSICLSASSSIYMCVCVCAYQTICL